MRHLANRRWLRLTAIVAEREIRQRGRSRAFAVSTIVLLLVVAAGVTIPAILAHHAKPQRVGIVGGPVASMTAIVQEAGHLTGTGVTVVPEPSLAAAEAALHSGQLDVVLVNDTEVVVKQVSIAMPVLYASGDVPGWQAAISAVLVAAGTVWMARTAATIYGRSILRTGSRVRLREVLGRAPVS